MRHHAPGHKSIKPRLSPIITACVRSVAPSFERILLTWFFTVCSDMFSAEAISPLELLARWFDCTDQ
jgi:hypothetical protein